MSFKKWIAGGLGWALLGPIGGIVGFLIGSAFEKQPEASAKGRQRTTTRGDFLLSLIVLTAAVMKADGVVKKGELDYVKKYFLQNFGQEVANDAIRMLRDILKQQIPIDDVSRQIANNLDYSSRLQLLHYLFGISSADGHTHTSEVLIIERIAKNMQVNTNDFNSIKSMFVADANAAYATLGLKNTASNDEVKKAYRKMAVEFHPDKVAYLGEDVQKSAKEKFQKINEAYETIKKERQMA